MKVKVLENFRDKYDKNIKYKKDDVIEITKKRYNEILKVGNLVQEIKKQNEEGGEKNGEQN